MRWLDGISWLNGHEFEQTLGGSEGQESLVCCSPWGNKESDTTEGLNNDMSYAASSRRAHSLESLSLGLSTSRWCWRSLRESLLAFSKLGDVSMVSRNLSCLKTEASMSWKVKVQADRDEISYGLKRVRPRSKQQKVEQPSFQRPQEDLTFFFFLGRISKDY